MLLCIKQYVEIREVEPLIYKLFDLFVSFRMEFASIYPLSKLWIVIDLAATIICVVFVTLVFRSDVIFKKRSKHLLF